MTQTEKLNAIPKKVYVTREQYGVPEYDIDYDDFGLAEFVLDMNIHDEGVNLFYCHRHDGEYYELWSIHASIYDNDGEELTHPTLGNCLEFCLDETIKHFTEHRDKYSFIETYSGFL